MTLRDAIAAVARGETLAREEARALFAEVLSGAADPVQLAGLLAALALRGERREELLGAAEALRESMRSFEHDAADAIDTCGTGGDGLGSFNLSTTAGLVACAAGARVVKHGNRGVSSSCGSADLLGAAGVAVELEPEAARAVLEEVGITFLYAPLYHPAMRHAAPVRRALGIRTLFNLLGPACNPGLVKRQLTGLAEAPRLVDYAAVLEELGCERGYVVHGWGGADELTLGGPNEALPLGDAPAERFDARELGLPAADVTALAGGGPDDNARILGSVLDGDPGPIADAVVLNAAAALVVAGVAQTAAEGVAQAREALASGAARAKLERWSESSRRRARAGGAA
jgi:anthranilate phosphoribosyltransferase